MERLFGFAKNDSVFSGREGTQNSRERDIEFKWRDFLSSDKGGYYPYIFGMIN